MHRFGELVAPLTFIGTAYVAIFFICWDVGTGSGGQYYLVTIASLVVLQFGVERIGLAALLATIGAALVITLQFLVPRSTGVDGPGRMSMSFVITTVSACVMVVVTVWFALRDTARAEAVMEAEYDRSEALLANMLPASIAERLKDPDRDVIADRYEDASVLFADIVGFTERASGTAPCDLVRSWTGSTAPSTRWWTNTGWRRSRSAATPTWWSAAFRAPGPTMSRRWRTLPSKWPPRPPD